MMKKTMIAAGAIAVALVAFQPATANAGVDFHFSFGAPGGHGGWHGGHGYHRERLSCGEVRRILRRHYGFRRLHALDCSGGRYTFSGRRHGDRWKINVNSYTGQVVRMYRA